LELARWIPVSATRLLYRQCGSKPEGNNLIPKGTHDPTSTIPVRMEFNSSGLENLQHLKERACPYLLAF
jgi:hypothetical protein